MGVLDEDYYVEELEDRDCLIKNMTKMIAEQDAQIYALANNLTFASQDIERYGLYRHDNMDYTYLKRRIIDYKDLANKALDSVRDKDD